MMRFEQLSEQDKDHLLAVYNLTISHEEKTGLLGDYFGVSDRTIRRWWSNLGLNKFKPSSFLEEAANRELPDVDVVLVTSAQNNTEVNKEFLHNLIKYKEHLEQRGKKVELVVVPVSYQKTKHEIIVWDDLVKPYLYYSKVIFDDKLIDANTTISITASNPLMGRELNASNNHLIVPHVRVHFKTLPRLHGMPLRTMLTTGVCTHKNYSETNVGFKSFYHHVFGFVVLEKGMIPRNVKATSQGDFVDLNTKVFRGKVTKVDKTLGMVLGDLHIREIDDDKMSQSYEVVKRVNPEKIYLHDVFDGSTLNPHEKEDLYILRKKIREGKHLINDEIAEALEFIGELKSWGPEIEVLQSNHDNFIDRYINNFNWKTDLHNSDAYLKYALIQQTQNLEEHGNIFGFLLSEIGVRYIKSGESEKLSNFLLSHGHVGVNGSRPTTATFRNLNIKSITGHTHAPMILDGLNVVGTSSKLWLYYNRNGFSSWAHGDIVVSEFGKSQLLVYNDEYKISHLWY